MSDVLSESFEDTTNWTHTVTVYDAATGQLAGTQEVGNIFVPRGWGFFFLHGPCTHDPQNTNGWSQPEACHLPATVDPVRVHTGLQGYKSFGFYRIVDCGLTRRITGLKAGQKIKVRAYAHGWTGSSDDPRTSEGVGTVAFAAPVGTLGLSDAARNATFRIGITTSTPDAGPYADETITWGIGWHIYNRYAQLEAEAIAEGDTVQIYLRGSTLWPYKHNDLYWDDVVVSVEDPEPEPEPEPQPQPVDYVVVVNLLPQDTSEAELALALERTYERRESIVYSADDAARLVAPGLPGSYVRVWNPERWTAGSIEDYLVDRGVLDVRLAWFDPDAPVPEPEPEQPEYELRSGNTIGLHSSFVGGQSWTYVDQSGATCQKFFSAGDAYRAGKIDPALISIWRKYVSGFPLGTPTTQALWYVDQYSAEITAAAEALGISEYELLGAIDGVESINEVIGSNALEGLRRGVEFDVAFAEILHARYGDALAPVLLNVAVGNPLEAEVQYLLPAAQAAERYNGMIGYHAYWSANQVQSFLVPNWDQHAGRWMAWDRVFTAAGCYPRYLATEGGICYAVDGWTFDSGLGWRATGFPFSRYLADLAEYNRRVNAWNATHGNRCVGLTVFCYAQWNWDSFLLGDGDVLALIAWSNTLAPMSAPLAEAATQTWRWRSVDDEYDRNILDLETYLRDANYLSADWRCYLERTLEHIKHYR